MQCQVKMRRVVCVVGSHLAMGHRLTSQTLPAMMRSRTTMQVACTAWHSACSSMCPTVLQFHAPDMRLLDNASCSCLYIALPAWIEPGQTCMNSSLIACLLVWQSHIGTQVCTCRAAAGTGM